jgi:hypothetical protein
VGTVVEEAPVGECVLGAVVGTPDGEGVVGTVAETPVGELSVIE